MLGCQCSYYYHNFYHGHGQLCHNNLKRGKFSNTVRFKIPICPVFNRVKSSTLVDWSVNHINTEFLVRNSDHGLIMGRYSGHGLNKKIVIESIHMCNASTLMYCGLQSIKFIMCVNTD